MLKAFQSIFGYGETRGRYPEALVDKAIERAVEGTDSRIRAIPGYRKQLRQPAVKAINHIVELVDRIPASVIASGSNFGEDPRFRALFTSRQNMLEILGSNASVRQHLRSIENRRQNVTMLLLATHDIKRALGIELDGEILRRDVVQSVANFGSYHLVDLAANEEETRRLLKRRAFDHLLELALKQITEIRGERTDLKRQRTLLLRKLRALEQQGWGFENTTGSGGNTDSLQVELEKIEEQLATLGTNDRTIPSHLEITAGLLENAERHLWAESVVLHLDRMNVQRHEQSTSARRVEFQSFRNSLGTSLVAMLISFSPGELPRQEHFSTAAKRHLANS